MTLLLAAVVIQLVPFGHTHTNPPVTKEPAWDSPQTATVIKPHGCGIRTWRQYPGSRRETSMTDAGLPPCYYLPCIHARG
jgi:hypothetical protein